MGKKTECKSDSDCPCSHQTCNTVVGECNVPWDKLGECFSQCFEKKADQKIVKYLKHNGTPLTSPPSALRQSLPST